MGGGGGGGGGGAWNIDNRCLILMVNLKVRKQTKSEDRKNNVTMIVFSKALHLVATLMDNFLVRDRCWPLVTDKSYYSSYCMSIMVHLASIKGTLDWTVRDEGFFLTEVFFTVSYTLCSFVCLLKVLTHTFYLLSEWPYWKTSQLKIYEI